MNSKPISPTESWQLRNWRNSFTQLTHITQSKWINFGYKIIPQRTSLRYCMSVYACIEMWAVRHGNHSLIHVDLVKLTLYSPCTLLPAHHCKEEDKLMRNWKHPYCKCAGLVHPNNVMLTLKGFGCPLLLLLYVIQTDLMVNLSNSVQGYNKKHFLYYNPLDHKAFNYQQFQKFHYTLSWSQSSKHSSTTRDHLHSVSVRRFSMPSSLNSLVLQAAYHCHIWNLSQV